MNPDELMAITRAWSYWDAPPPAAVVRHVDLPDALRESLALVVQGVRRCGKSTLLRQLMARYSLPPAHCAFINFEDPRLSQHLEWPTLDHLVDAFAALHPEAPSLTFFLDEIQNVTGWERWLRTQLDRPRGHHFVVTGSNAALLSGELGATLTGRHRMIELYPFDLREYQTARPGAPLVDYLREGGFPEPLATPFTPRDADALRRQYFLDIVERDIRERVGARSSRPIQQVAQMAFESAGSELSLRRVAAAAGLAIETAGSYLAACESAYLLFSVPFFAYSERKRAAYNRKYYPIDSGLRRVVVTLGPEDRGKALECAVAVALRRRYQTVSYWRGTGEVDFIVQDGRRVIPFQVTLDAPQPRHERGLLSFYEQFPHADEAVFVTLDTFAQWSAQLDA